MKRKTRTFRPKANLWPPAIGLRFPIAWMKGGTLRGWSGLPFLVLLDPWASDLTWRHELVHQRQLWRYWVFGFWWGYLSNADFRRRMEAEAYEVD